GISRGRRMTRRLVSGIATAGLLIGMLAVVPASVFALSCTPPGPAVPAAPLPGSCFEGYDGDQVDSDGTGAGNDRLDWQTVTSTKVDDFASVGRDSQFGPGGSEEIPDSWTFAFGSLGSGKYDVISGWSSVEPNT